MCIWVYIRIHILVFHGRSAAMVQSNSAAASCWWSRVVGANPVKATLVCIFRTHLHHGLLQEKLRRCAAAGR